jgi:putative ABC transport system ATP-binding protein
MPVKVLDHPAPVASPAAAAMPSQPIIQLENLSKSYSEAGKTRLILDSLNLEFMAGEFVCLVGKSGSGKSTLLNLISGIDAPTQGHITIYTKGETESEAVRLTALSDHERTLFRRHHIGIVFQFFNLIPTLTVLENVTLPLELAGVRGNGRREATQLLERVGLGNRLATYPDRLSGGEQQRHGQDADHGDPCARCGATGRPRAASCPRQIGERGSVARTAPRTRQR